MKVKWKTLLFRASVWLIVEISLNLLGLDSLADYSEFVFDRNQIALTS